MTTYRTREAVVLTRDLPEHKLRKGDLGTVVEVYWAGGVEVEFLTASGRTAAVVTLDTQDVRPGSDDDLMAVRPSRP